MLPFRNSYHDCNNSSCAPQFVLDIRLLDRNGTVRLFAPDSSSERTEFELCDYAAGNEIERTRQFDDSR